MVVNACADRVAWAKALLSELGYPQSTANERAIVAWAFQEGGGFGVGAAFNPMNTTMPASGTTNYNWATVKN